MQSISCRPYKLPISLDADKTAPETLAYRRAGAYPGKRIKHQIARA